MNVLIVEPLPADVVKWLSERHQVQQAPALAEDPAAFRAALRTMQAAILPPSVTVDATVLQGALGLRVIGRVSGGAENLDKDACTAAGVRVVRPGMASAAAEAEFTVSALLHLLRRMAVPTDEGLMVGRELGACEVGIVGMVPAARPLVDLLGAFGARVVGYDPMLHANDPHWARWNVRPVSLADLMKSCDAVCLLMTYHTRYRGLINERLLSQSRQHQVLVNLSHSSLFDEAALVQALRSGRLAGAWLDSVDPHLAARGGLFHGVEGLKISPRVASTTRESRLRAAWTVARKLDELLTQPPARAGFGRTAPGELRTDPVLMTPIVRDGFKTTAPGDLTDL